MAPLWWEILSMLFLIMFSMMIMLVYFSVTKINNKMMFKNMMKLKM